MKKRSASVEARVTRGAATTASVAAVNPGSDVGGAEAPVVSRPRRSRSDSGGALSSPAASAAASTAAAAAAASTASVTHIHSGAGGMSSPRTRQAARSSSINSMPDLREKEGDDADAFLSAQEEEPEAEGADSPSASNINININTSSNTNTNSMIQQDASASPSTSSPHAQNTMLSALSPVGKAFKVRIKLTSDSSARSSPSSGLPGVNMNANANANANVGLPAKLKQHSKLLRQPSKKETQEDPILGDDGNLFYCHICGDVGDVVCCDGCPRVYHPTCVPKGVSRRSLDNDDDPWHCHLCLDQGLKPNTQDNDQNSLSDPKTGLSGRRGRSRSSNSRKCCVCQKAGGQMEPCSGCSVYLHYPSCRTSEDPKTKRTTDKPLCTSCYALLLVAAEEEERSNSSSPNKRNTRKTSASAAAEGIIAQLGGGDFHAENDDEEDDDDDEDDDLTSPRKRRKRGEEDPNDETAGAESPILGDAESFEDDPSGSILGRRKKTQSPRQKQKVKKRRGRPPMSAQEKDAKARERKEMRKRERENVTPYIEDNTEEQTTGDDDQRMRKKKRKQKEKNGEDANLVSPRSAARSSTDIGSRSPSTAIGRFTKSPVKATPAFFFFLADNKLKIERTLLKTNRLFKRTTKGFARNEIIATEGAIWWSKMTNKERRRYVNESMQEFEENIIAWKEEENIRSMVLAGGDESDEGTADPPKAGPSEEEGASLSQEDEAYLFRRHQRLFNSTTLQCRSYKRPIDSSNRVLLELLRDMRFHPLPMVQPTRSESDLGYPEYSKMTIPFFDVHGPVSTGVGDECMGCTRGWNHFCPVLKRKIPAAEHRSKLQPSLSSLMATRISLGLKLPPVEEGEPINPLISGKESEIFSMRETLKAAEARRIAPITSLNLNKPSTRADDIVQFVEEAIWMKVPEPPAPEMPTIIVDAEKKAPLMRGALPTKKMRTQVQPEGGTKSEGEVNPTEPVLYKCGRCRAIIRNSTGCVQCRRAQLVVDMSKRQPVVARSATSKPNGSQSPSEEGPGFLKIQTVMLGRAPLRDSNFDRQPEGDRAIGAALTNMRWFPNAILPPEKMYIPTPKASGDDDETSSSMDDDEEYASKSIQGPHVNQGQTVHAHLLVKEDEGKKDWEEEKNMMTDDGSSSQSTTSAPAPAPGPPRSPSVAARKQKRIVRGPTLTLDDPDRQAVAKAHQDEATELNRSCLSVATCGILLALTRRDPLRLFAEAVSNNIQGYHAVIKKPIDFSYIRAKVLKKQYTTLGAFIADVRLLCSNSLLFNPPGSIYSKTAKELQDALEKMQKRASTWMSAIKNAHTSSLLWRRSSVASKDESREGDGDQNAHDPFKELRTTWPGAVDLLENGDWLRFQIEADFMRTRENENAYYSSLAVRRAAIAAETALGPYPDSGGIKQPCVRRSHIEDEELRQWIDKRVAQLIDPVQLKDEPSWREEAILKVLRRVQSRRVEGRIASDSGCVRCDGVQVEEDAKLAMTAEAVRAGRNRRKGDVVVPRVAASRLKLSTGLASANNRKQLVEEESAQAAHGPNIASMGSITGREISVSVSGSGIHGWGLFADHPFKKGQVVAEYVGELITNAVADAREKMYQERRIQDYQFRVDNSLVIDATMKGGHARYINHNCTPNCIAKIVDGVPPNQHLKRVIIISKRSIEAREEITYDYQFPLELDLDARIPCNCGSRDCRGFMNWDLPEKGSNRVERNQTRGTKIRDRIRRIGRGDARAAAKSEAHP